MIVEPDFLTHWKTRALAGALEDDRAPLYVIALWSHCQQRKTDRLERMPSIVLAQICGWTGEPEKFVTALISCGWLELLDDSDDMIVHDFRMTNAGLFANWKRGLKGGRPRKPVENQSETGGKPVGNPPQTQREPTTNQPKTRSQNGLPTANQPQTDRLDRLDREDNPPHSPPTSSANGSGEGREEKDLVYHAEAKSKIWEIGKRVYKIQGAWSERQIYDDWLNEAVPIPREQFEALLWLYALPDNHAVFTSEHAAYAKRRGSFPSLLGHLVGEVQKASQLCQKISAANRKENMEEPPGWLAK